MSGASKRIFRYCITTSDQKTGTECSRCLYTTDHPLGLIIEKNGICSGCHIHEEKNKLDWMHRWSKLKQLVKPYRSLNKKNYDCIVPVSGAQDSYFILYIVKERLKLNPLLVTYNKHYNTPLGISNLSNLRTRHNCDILIQNVNPISTRKITRATLTRFGSVYWHCLAGQTSFPVQIAVRNKIPLIIWGAHQGLEQVGMFSHMHEVQMTRRYRKDHDLLGYESDDLLSFFDNLHEEDIWQYRYPDDKAINQIGVVGIYLSNYIRWDPKAQHEQMISKYGYRTSKFKRTFDCYDYVDCFNYMNLHDQLKLLKHGFSKVTDHACREIRHGRMTRGQALKLVRYYQQQPPENLDLFCRWLGISFNGLNFLLNRFRNPKFWQLKTPGKWILKNSNLSKHQNKNSSLPFKKPFYVNNELVTHEKHHKYITFGKGYP